jgi:branched-chain amino acid transport system ATP-binding protein
MASNGAKTILEVTDIHTFYGSIEALKGISITVDEGEIVTLIGANGAGKSTTLRSISGIVPPRTGRIVFQGAEIQGLAGHEVAEIGIAQSPEGRRIFPRMTVLENLEMGAFTRRDQAAIREDIARVYDLFPRLKERERQKGGTMSGGEQQMLAMARALATEPALLLLDEISMGLAPLIVAELFEHVKRIAEDGVAILLTEQYARTALEISDYAAIMTQGKVRAIGEPSDIAKELSGAYLGGTK